MIKSEDLSYDYVRRSLEGDEEITHALNNVNIQINDGEFVAILGHNGSGKSTFAKCLNGLITKTRGDVFVDGIKVANDDNLWEIRKKTGMVFQNPDNQLVATIVEDDVAFGCENLGIETSEIRRRVDDALKWVGMYEQRESSPSMLSGGQKQRVAIAGILAMKPTHIVFDEPTAMLDPKGRKEVIETAHRLNREDNIAVVLITHFMEEAVNADKVYVLNDGEVAFYGTPKEVFTRVSELKELGLTVPTSVLIAEGLKQKGIDIPLDILSIDELSEFLIDYKKNLK